MKHKAVKTKEDKPKEATDTILVKLKRGTRARLGDLGKYGESLDDIVNRLIDSYPQ